jgi:membrane-bound lytic murein transglycosylase D
MQWFGHSLARHVGILTFDFESVSCENLVSFGGERFMKMHLLIGCVAFVSASCATSPTTSNIDSQKDADFSEIKSETIDTPPILAAPTSKKVSDEPLSARLTIEQNGHVQKWVRYFSVQDKERFERFIERGQAYREVVENVLSENEIPPELYYLAMIESGYSTAATSHAKAVGVWQFMPGTGHRYGLQRDAFIDERRDPIRATEAAAKYLKDLYNVFHSWPLAIAAYNSGEFRIINAIMRGRTRDFWELSRMNLLPRETAEYVPKFFAAVLVGRNASRYGLRVPNTPKFPDVESIEVPSPVRLADLARSTGVSEDDLRRLNPHLHRGITPPSAKSYEVWVRSTDAEKFKKVSEMASIRLKDMRPYQQLIAKSEAKFRAENHYYMVKQGDTLMDIARQNNLSLTYLRKINGMKNSTIFTGKKLRLVAKSYHRANPVSETTPSRLQYHVKRGDNLFRIAQRFGVTIDQLRRENRLRKNEVQAGQVIRVSVNRSS